MRVWGQEVVVILAAKRQSGVARVASVRKGTVGCHWCRELSLLVAYGFLVAFGCGTS